MNEKPVINLRKAEFDPGGGDYTVVANMPGIWMKAFVPMKVGQEEKLTSMIVFLPLLQIQQMEGKRSLVTSRIVKDGSEASQRFFPKPKPYCGAV